MERIKAQKRNAKKMGRTNFYCNSHLCGSHSGWKTDNAEFEETILRPVRVATKQRREVPKNEGVEGGYTWSYDLSHLINYVKLNFICNLLFFKNTYVIYPRK